MKSLFHWAYKMGDLVPNKASEPTLHTASHTTTTTMFIPRVPQLANTRNLSTSMSSSAPRDHAYDGGNNNARLHAIIPMR